MDKFLARSVSRFAFLNSPITQGFLTGFAAPLMFLSVSFPLQIENVPNRLSSVQSNSSVARAWRNVGRRITVASEKVRVDGERQKST